MKILVCPNTFKESMDAAHVALHIENGIRKIFPSARIIKIPLADGGTGTIKSISSVLSVTIKKANVVGPLGKRIKSYYAITNDKKMAIIEMAQAAGLALIPKEKRNPFFTTTYGVGELIKKCLDDNVPKILIGMGDSGTNDGGVGMAQALGVKFFAQNNKEIGFGGMELLKLKYVDVSGIDKRIYKTKIIGLSDVKNPLTGKNGASFVFAPQKGATKTMVKVLERALVNYENVLKNDLEKNVDVPGAGAAGGLGAGLMAFLNADIISGAKTIMEITKLEKEIKKVDLVITGEGKLDAQTIKGKIPFAIARHAFKYKVPVIAIAGCVDKTAEVLYGFGMSAMISIANGPMTLEESKQNVGPLIENTIKGIMRLIKINCKQ